MKFSEKEYVNQKAILGHTIVAVVLSLAYLLEFIKGSRTIYYTIIMLILFVAPVIVERIAFARDRESVKVRHIVSVGFMIMYLCVIGTTHSEFTYTYVFALFFLMLLFMEVKACVAVGIAAILGNIGYVIYYAFTTGFETEQIPDVEIRIASTVVIAVFMVLATIVVKKVNEEKLSEIQEKTDQTTGLLDRILEASDNMLSGIGQASEKTKLLGESMSQIHDSMAEVSTGSTETAESIETQLHRTEEIQEHIVRVKDTTTAITRNMMETNTKVEEGQSQMEALAGQVEKSMAANNHVIQRMQALSEYTVQMNTIIETITSIANSTGMLALNASIEAARAGESGRGFAVVASEISDLASQTKSATVNITELIGNINRELSSVEAAVDVVTKSNHANQESTQMVTENFAGITRSTEDIERQTEELLRIVGELETSNTAIMENIQTISAITQQVSAHANETFNACEENTELVSSVTQIVTNLNVDAQKLQVSK